MKYTRENFDDIVDFLLIQGLTSGYGVSMEYVDKDFRLVLVDESRDIIFRFCDEPQEVFHAVIYETDYTKKRIPHPPISRDSIYDFMCEIFSSSSYTEHIQELFERCEKILDYYCIENRDITVLPNHGYMYFGAGEKYYSMVYYPDSWVGFGKFYVEEGSKPGEYYTMNSIDFTEFVLNLHNTCVKGVCE